jgi:IS30 family transposase
MVGLFAAGVVAVDGAAGAVRDAHRARCEQQCRVSGGGINRWTGTRWPVWADHPGQWGSDVALCAGGQYRRTTISTRYLSEDERLVIGDLHRAGLGVRAIAVELDRAPSTVSRELRRNRNDGSGRYRPYVAHKLAAERRARPRRRRVAADVVLREFVQAQLSAKWSPEQISHALSVQFPGEPARQLVPESIYQALHSRELCLNRRLRSGRPYPSRRCPSGYLILGVLCVRAIATGMVGRRWGCLVTGWAGKIV